MDKVIIATQTEALLIAARAEARHNAALRARYFRHGVFQEKLTLRRSVHPRLLERLMAREGLIQPLPALAVYVGAVTGIAYRRTFPAEVQA